MAATESVRDKKQLKELANYFLSRGQLRNHAMVVVGACTSVNYFVCVGRTYMTRNDRPSACTLH